VIGLLGVLFPVSAAVLTTITVDGDMSDWSAVLADPYQTAYDGPAAGLVDRDAPIQSTGRDLLAFAWTYDDSHLFLYINRAASISNQQLFWFYVDTNDDGLMQSGEPVISVDWKGSNRSTTIYRHSYTATAPGGDPLGDPDGFADGWTMPGSVSSGLELERIRSGAWNGVEMETRVSWADLGVAPGSSVRFHVSSSNSWNVPNQIDDNMGGPGGQVGTTRIPGVEITPSTLSGTVVPGGLLPFAHSVANTGSHPDTINLGWSSTGSFVPSSIRFHHDVDGDGLLSPSDPLLGDTDGDGSSDTGPLGIGASLPVLAVLEAPASVGEGDSATLTVTVTSSACPVHFDSASDSAVVATPAMTLVKAVSESSGPPGTLLTYTVTYLSNGSTPAYNVAIVDEVPPDTTYEPGSASGAGATIEFSHDGGASFDGSEAAPVTHVRWSFPAPLAPGETGQVSFEATIR
jgi:uncharacterized repeat protein (TIGR01451 family)